MSWKLAPALNKLRTQVNKEWPKRNKASDGTIGDLAHSSTVSQHNPNRAGVVTAMDITHDPKHGADMNKLKEKIIKDSRVWYVIFNRRIWESGKWSTYTGINPHDKHLHVSTKQTSKYYNDSKDWTIGGTIDDMYKGKSAKYWYDERTKYRSAWQKELKKRKELEAKLLKAGDPTSNDQAVKDNLYNKIKGIFGK